MKKGNTETKGKKEEKKLFNVASIHFNSIDDIIEGKEVNGKRTSYPLYGGVTLTITDTDKDYDFGQLNVFGLCVNVTIFSGKEGMFISYPSYKNKDGEYVNLVNNFDKDFNSIIKEVLARHYE